MRLFVAVEIAPSVIEVAQALVGELGARAQSLAPQARITWIPPQLMHLTVRFIGEAGASDLHLVTGALAAPIPVPPIPLTLSGVGAFPARGSPRVIWGAITAGAAELTEVERELSARLRRIGVGPDDRAFTPHLTLARVREPADLRTEALLEGFETRPLGTSRVDAITLFESRLSAKGPTYVPIHRTPLRAG